MIVGVEGSGHHALEALLDTSPATKFITKSDANRLIARRIAAENATYFSVARWSGAVIQKIFGPPEIIVVGKTRPPRNSALDSELRRYLPEQRTEGITVLDASIPFGGGVHRSHLNHFDYFALAQLLARAQTKVIFLNRSAQEVSYSIFRRGVYNSLLQACRSTEVSLSIFRDARLALADFESFELDYDSLTSNPGPTTRRIESFLEIDHHSLNEEVIVAPKHELTDDQLMFLDQFWVARRET